MAQLGAKLKHIVNSFVPDFRLGRVKATTTGFGSKCFATILGLSLICCGIADGARSSTSLHSFHYDTSDGTVPVASMIDMKGTLYGTTEDGGVYGLCTGFKCGTVFSITPSGTEHVLHSFGYGTDGESPAASLIAVNGTLYGTTAYGGTNGAGTIFSISTTGTEHVLYNFGSSSTDGASPYASLIDVKGILYSTTLLGGAHGDATVFSLKP